MRHAKVTRQYLGISSHHHRHCHHCHLASLRHFHLPVRSRSHPRLEHMVSVGEPWKGPRRLRASARPMTRSPLENTLIGEKRMTVLSGPKQVVGRIQKRVGNVSGKLGGFAVKRHNTEKSERDCGGEIEAERGRWIRRKEGRKECTKEEKRMASRTTYGKV